MLGLEIKKELGALILVAFLLAAPVVPFYTHSGAAEQDAADKPKKLDQKMDSILIEKLNQRVASNDNRDYEIVISLFDGEDLAPAKSRVAAFLNEHAAVNVRVMKELPFITAKLPAAKILDLPDSSDITIVGDGEEVGEPLGEIDIGDDFSQNNSILGIEKQQAIQSDMDVARQVVRANLVTQTGTGIDLAILDRGIHLCGSSSSCHPDFAGRVTNVYDYTGRGYNDDQGHGTALATIAAASGTESSGTYKGIAPAVRIMNFKLYDATLPPSPANVIDAMDRAITHPNRAEVILLAIGFGCTTSSVGNSIRNAVNSAIERGVTVVSGSGNAGTGGITSPGCAANAITAGAIDDNDSTSSSNWVMWSGSGQGPTSDGMTKPDIVAPGEGLYVLKRDANPNDSLSLQYYNTGGGTSYSAAAAAGVAALLYQKNPSWTPAQIKAAIKQTADPYNLGTSENIRGKGVIDAYDAINLASTSINYANAYAFTIPSYPSLSTFTAMEYSGDTVRYKFSKESSGISVGDGKLKGTTVFKRISFPSTKIAGISQTLSDSKLFAGPRVERGSSFAFAYVTYKISSTDTVKLLFSIASGSVSPYALFTSTTSKTFESTQYINFDINTSNIDDKATLFVSPYTPYNVEQKFTVGTDFNIRGNSPLEQPWLKFNDQGSGTIIEWILKWKSTESPVADPDTQYSSTESIDGSGDGDNILVYYRGSRSGTAVSVNPIAYVQWSYPP